jgi:transposase-like protein
VVKIRQDKRVINKAVYLALGVNMEGRKELLGLWLAENEGAKFWLNVLTELQNRGVKDILIACVDGLKGFPDAINTAYPETRIQLCIVHMVRNSMKYVPWKDYKHIAADLKKIYQSATEEEALLALDQFSEIWDEKYPQISRSWRSHWHNLNTLFNYPEDIRKAIYTTDEIDKLFFVGALSAIRVDVRTLLFSALGSVDLAIPPRSADRRVRVVWHVQAQHAEHFADCTRRHARVGIHALLCNRPVAPGFVIFSASRQAASSRSLVPC